MNYQVYLVKSTKVFILCFFIGIYINKLFTKIQKQNSQLNPLILAFIQLLVVITVTYILHYSKFFNTYFEIYTPNVVFSSFLLSLQTNMISNFKNAFENL
jgi:dolichyl-phosphate-mannose--protein O-mannosyl transferase